MTDKKILDVRGLYCPEPVMNVKAAIKEMGSGSIEVLVDCGAPLENVTRAASYNGWEIAVEDISATEKRLILTK